MKVGLLRYLFNRRPDITSTSPERGCVPCAATLDGFRHHPTPLRTQRPYERCSFSLEGSTCSVDANPGVGCKRHTRDFVVGGASVGHRSQLWPWSDSKRRRLVDNPRMVDWQDAPGIEVGGVTVSLEAMSLTSGRSVRALSFVTTRLTSLQPRVTSCSLQSDVTRASSEPPKTTSPPSRQMPARRARDHHVISLRSKSWLLMPSISSI